MAWVGLGPVLPEAVVVDDEAVAAAKVHSPVGDGGVVDVAGACKVGGDKGAADNGSQVGGAGSWAAGEDRDPPGQGWI